LQEIKRSLQYFRGQQLQFRQWENAAIGKSFYAIKVIHHLLGIGHHINDRRKVKEPEGASGQENFLRIVGREQYRNCPFHKFINRFLLLSDMISEALTWIELGQDRQTPSDEG